MRETWCSQLINDSARNLRGAEDGGIFQVARSRTAVVMIKGVDFIHLAERLVPSNRRLSLTRTRQTRQSRIPATLCFGPGLACGRSPQNIVPMLVLCRSQSDMIRRDYEERLSGQLDLLGY